MEIDIDIFDVVEEAFNFLEKTTDRLIEKQVCQKILDIDPNTKIIISSGNRDEYTTNNDLSCSKGFIDKPFKLDDFERILRNVLDS